MIHRSLSTNVDWTTWQQQVCFAEDQNLVTIHAVYNFDDLPLGMRNFDPQKDGPGPAGEYEDRARLLGDIVFMRRSVNRSNQSFLEDIGVAPRETHLVEGNALIPGIRADRTIMNMVVQLGKDPSNKFQCFASGPQEDALLVEAGLDYHTHTLSCPPHIAPLFGNKANLRRMTETKEWKKIYGDAFFAPYVICNKYWTPESLEKAIHDVRKRGAELGFADVIVKRTDQASGGGMMRSGDPGFADFIKRQVGHELIVETFIPDHEAISIQYLINDGKITVLSASKQIQEGLVHKGNIISSDDHVLQRRHVLQLRSLTEPFVLEALKLKYNGIIGFDAVLLAARGIMFLTEANDRATATTYPIGVVRKLQRMPGAFSPWAVANEMFMEPNVVLADWDDVYRALGKKLFNPAKEHGIIPYMIGGLQLKRGRRIGLMVIGNYAHTVEILLEEAKAALS